MIATDGAIVAWIESPLLLDEHRPATGSPHPIAEWSSQGDQSFGRSSFESGWLAKGHAVGSRRWPAQAFRSACPPCQALHDAIQNAGGEECSFHRIGRFLLMNHIINRIDQMSEVSERGALPAA